MALGTSRAGVLADATLVDRTRHQTALRLLPFIFVLYIVNYLDRTSVAYAAMGMSRDLGFSDRVFGLGVGVFFIGYLALQIPGSLLAAAGVGSGEHDREYCGLPRAVGVWVPAHANWVAGERVYGDGGVLGGVGGADADDSGAAAEGAPCRHRGGGYLRRRIGDSE